MVRLLLALLMVTAAFSQSQLSVTLTPAAANSQGRIPWLDVTIAFHAPQLAAGKPVVAMPIVFSNVETVAQAIGEMTLEDSQGRTVLVAGDEKDVRRWSASRATEGSVVVRYRAPISNVAAPRGAAPPLEPRSDSGAFSGGGEALLALPEDVALNGIELHWDLRHMPAGAKAVSSLGHGDCRLETSSVRERLRSTFFMAGALHLYPEKPAPTGFFSAWHGSAPMDLRALMESQERLYAFYGKFFERTRLAPYGIFLRENPVNSGGGVELSGSFVATFGPTTDASDLKITLAHEMLHTFAGSLAQPEGLEGSWYSEGLAVYYARLLALRAGEITPAEFLADLNTTAGRYYTNAFIGSPNAEVPKRFWTDTRIRVLPYDRGSMYFAVVDGQVRAASGGKQTLDDLLRGMPARQATEATWIEIVEKFLGERGKAGFQKMLAGDVMLPESGGFGPCFTRTKKLLRRYELGFDPVVLTERKRIIRGLVAGSAAARAGLRDGDEITRPVPQDKIQGEQDGVLVLRILREGKATEIRYQPRGESVEAWQWTRVKGVPDSACAY